jgi:hypothetical protein
MTNDAKFSFSFSDGTLEVSGSELFVTQQVEGFRQVIIDALQQAATMPVVVHRLPMHSQGAVEDAPVPSSGGPKHSEPSTNPYPYVLDVMNDKIKITKSMKGSNTAEKAIKLILSYMWGKEKLLGQSTADYKELRDLCEEHACLDSSNFSSTLTSKKQWIVVDGVKGSSGKVCKLTYPGREKAEEMLKEMNEG